jgi:hypothetical protein
MHRSEAETRLAVPTAGQGDMQVTFLEVYPRRSSVAVDKVKREAQKCC